MCICRREAWFLLLCLTLSLTGCNRALHYDKTLSMGPGDVKSFSVDPPRSEQKVTITFTSSAVPVSVYVALEKDLETASKAIENYKQPDGILAKQEKAREGSIEAVIPAKSGFGVIVAGAANDTSVQVKLTGK
jgi:hypothetical protein